MCDASGKPIISIFSPDKPYTVYDQKIRRSDQRDPMDYGQDYDFSKTFFEQCDSLFKNVPQGIQTADSENCDYAVFGTNNKNCYLTSCMSYSENCLYARFIHKSQYCMDCCVAIDSKECYECTDIHDCYNMKFSNNCTWCADSYFLENCIGCTNCFGCTNLVNKKHCFENTQYDPEGYMKKIKEIDLGSSKTLALLKEKITNKTRIVKSLNNENCENCFGDYITNSKNWINVFDCFDLEDSKNCRASWDMKDIYDASFVWFKCDVCYEVSSSEQIHNCLFSSWINLSDSLYTYTCLNSSHLFGCIGLRHKHYCILNKQYTKEEYEILVPKIIEHMKKTGERWEFFSWSISPFGYNETIAMEYFPLSREEATKRWYKRMDKEYPINVPANAQTINAQDFPDKIDDIADDILNKVITCEVTGKPFRVVKPELEFYRKHNLPLPHKHPDQRHIERMQLRNPRKLRDRACAKCWTAIKTTYAPEKPEIVYCESCYHKEIYW